MNRIYLIPVIIFLLTGQAFSQEEEIQDTIYLTLDQVVEMAKEESPEGKKAHTLFENRYWQYESFRADYMPQLSLSGQVPNFNRSIEPVTQNDGTEAFRSRSYSSSTLDLGINQQIGLTGGTVSFGSQLERIDVFTDTVQTTYLANPAVVSYRQPIMNFNNYEWDKKIEPLKYKKARKELNENIEKVGVQATELYFNLLLAQISLQIAEKNLSNSDTLLQISKGRYNLGKIAENELLQMELSLMNDSNDAARASLDVEMASLELAIFLGMSGKEIIKLDLPGEVPRFYVDESNALSFAIDNNSKLLDLNLQKLQAKKNLARAKRENGFSADLSASYGLTNSSPLLGSSYVNPLNQQRLRLGFNIPIIDWGRAKARKMSAKADLELTEVTVEQGQKSFEQDIKLLVRRFNMYRQNLRIAEKADDVAQKRYDIALKRYKIGKIGVLDLNVANQEKDAAKRQYIQALKTFWKTYFELRQKTHYDFGSKEKINVDSEY